MLCSNVDLCMPTVCATIESNVSEIFQPSLTEANKMFDVIFDAECTEYILNLLVSLGEFLITILSKVSRTI